MAIKLAILLFGAILLLAQTTYSAPVDSGESFFDELSNIFKLLADRFEIVKITLNEVHDLDELVQKEGITVLKKVLADPEVLEVKSDSMQKYLNEIREYVAKLEKGESSSNFLEFIDFEDLVNKFEKEKVEDITKEAEIIGKSLKKNGLEEFEETVTNHFDKFVEKFTGKIDAFLDKLSDGEKKDEKTMVDWFKKFVDEKDFNKKLNLFDDFFIAETKSSEKTSKENLK